MNPAARARAIIAVGALVPAVVLGVVALVISVIAAPIVFVIVAVALAVWLSRGGDWLIRRALGGEPADPDRHARFINLVDGLSVTAGVRPPELLVIPERSPNLLVAGRNPDHTILAATTGLLEGLSRIELEGVLADGLVQIRRGDLVPATVAAATFGLATGFAVGSADDTGLDEAGVALTRYPPALISALEVMERTGTAVGAVRRANAHLWVADPWPSGQEGTSGRPALAQRVAALREL